MFAMHIPAIAQLNLVPNGSFEEYDTCPDNCSLPDNMQINHCAGWYSPTAATSDYFNSCADNMTGVNVPNNGIGFQYANSGNGYCGFLAYVKDELYNLNWWEYIQTKLSQSLSLNHFYKVSFYLSLSDNSELCTSNIGVCFSKDPIGSSTFAPLMVTPSITWNSYVTDKTNWVLKEAIFFANGGEQYITIGPFGDTINIDTLRLQPISGYNFAYYYIDDVKVEDITDSFVFPNVFTPNGDGINDEIDFSMFTNSQIQIFNRWGRVVFDSKSDGYKWDGKNKNNHEDCAEGVYFWILRSEENNKMNGSIQLLK